MKKIKLSVFSKVILTCTALDAVFLILFKVMEALGYQLIRGDLLPMLVIVFFVLLAIWGIGAMIRHMRHRIARLVSVCMSCLVALTFLVVLLNYFSTFVGLNYFFRFNEITLESGKTVVVMYRMDYFQDDYDATYDRMLTRAEHRLSQLDEAAYNESFTADGDLLFTRSDLGYTFTVYPRAMKFFINTNQKYEGEIYRGVDSQAKLMYEYSEDHSEVRFYLENPEIGDSGEIIGTMAQ